MSDFLPVRWVISDKPAFRERLELRQTIPTINSISHGISAPDSLDGLGRHLAM